MVFFLLLFVPATICISVANHYYRKAVRDLRQYLPHEPGNEYPSFYWSFFGLLDLYREYYPQNRIPVVIQSLTYLGFTLLVIFAAIGLVVVFSKPVAH